MIFCKKTIQRDEFLFTFFDINVIVRVHGLVFLRNIQTLRNALREEGVLGFVTNRYGKNEAVTV